MDRHDLLDAVLRHLGPRYRALATTDGQVALVDELRRRCATLGRRVRVALPGGSVLGTAVDLSGTGSLVVEHDGGRTELAAGDVVHVRPGD